MKITQNRHHHQLWLETRAKQLNSLDMLLPCQTAQFQDHHLHCWSKKLLLDPPFYWSDLEVFFHFVRVFPSTFQLKQLAKVIFGSWRPAISKNQENGEGKRNDLSTLPLKTEVEIFRGWGGGCACPLCPSRVTPLFKDVFDCTMNDGNLQNLGDNLQPTGFRLSARLVSIGHFDF